MPGEFVLVDEPARGAALEPPREVGRLATRGQDHDRPLRPLGESLGDREAVRVRQDDVEEDELRAQRLDGGERRGPVVRLADDGEAAGLEQPAGEAAEPGVVVHDQHRPAPS